MTWTPHATVAVVVEQNGRFLLVEETSNGQYVFNQPAGHIEHGESILDAARREALEETGWEVEPTHLIGLYTYTAPSNGVTYYRLCFAAQAIRQTDSPLDSDILAVHWLDQQQLSDVSVRMRSPLVMRCIDDFIAGKRFPLDLITEFA